MEQLRDQLKLAEYNLEAAKLRVQNSRFESDVTQKQAAINLKQTQIQLEQARQSINNQKIIQKANLMQMNLQVANIRSEIQDIRNRINRFVLLAPAPGMVVYGEAWFGGTSRKIRVGDKVRPGQELIRIPNLDFIESVVYVNEVDIQLIKPGQRAQLWLEAHPHRIYHGLVTSISKISQPENFVRGQIWDQPSSIHVFPAHVKITNPDSSLKPGMTIKTRVLLDTIPNALLIPTTAVGEINGKPFVFTKKGKRAVRLGKRNDCDVIVLKGLSEKDFVQDPPPLDRMAPLGRLAFYEAHLAKADSLSRQIDRMQKRGFTYDYEANRGKTPEPAPVKKLTKGGSLPPQIQRMLKSQSAKQAKTGKKKLSTKPKEQKERE
ncbi:MAG: HlyD family efflux transporter periplasmic adaptor subunit, partial [Calditrichaeota bacterium]|nr:HlyD family efflux transporter periplasmic adaptor subunit [Calditrichota bacterium]